MSYFRHNDKYAVLAQKNNYLSRAAYKLLEIHTKYNILRTGRNIIDIGAAPGSWTQVILQINPTAIVTAVDIEPMQITNKRVIPILSDIVLYNCTDKYDVLLSDIAPYLSGIKTIDNIKCQELHYTVLQMIHKVLNHHGMAVIKLFRFQYYNDIVRELKKLFKFIHPFKPAASRDSSNEIYIVCLHKLAS